MNKTTQSLLGAMLLLATLFPACRKEPYIPPFEEPAPTCVLDEATYRITTGSNTSTEKVLYTPVYFDEDIVGFRMLSDDDDVVFNFDDGFRQFDWGINYYNCYYNYQGWPDYITYLPAPNLEVHIEVEYAQSSTLKSLVVTNEYYLNPSADRDFVIDSVKYVDGNIVSYRYREIGLDWPYTVYSTKYYEFAYDLNHENNKTGLYHQRVFSILPLSRFMMPNNHSTIDHLDVQAFSKNLVVRKTDITQSTVVFNKTYIFDSEQKVVECLQTFFPDAGNNPAKFRTTYSYTCE